MKKFALLFVISAIIFASGCAFPTKVEVGMTISEANDILILNKSREMKLEKPNWENSTWRVYTLPDNTCVQLFCESADDLVITDITVGEKGKGYWIDEKKPNTSLVKKFDIDDYKQDEED